ncbi:hypothetical protein I6A60_22510 [Frankia sp. AgB1.9]|nr:MULTISPECIES: NAD(P)-binding domain-containing protein [unclassified Frankia]MBL7489444.1 hypothetical protein [Frankia sp. AgW1.1]MBL7550621.1 hypothetical protein [Frankia sp. AgB1.9]MBL7621004.1 hypothetical protein [Frankia sp. AgB1.8]
MTATPRVGFVGLGDQGAPMAQRIVKAGFTTTLWARRPATLSPFAGLGARFADAALAAMDNGLAHRKDLHER